MGNGVLDLYHAGTMLENIKLTNRGKVAACNGINHLLVIGVGAGLRNCILALTQCFSLLDAPVP